MSGLLFDRMNNKQNFEDKNREYNARYSKSPTGTSSTSGRALHHPRINSLSPSSHTSNISYTQYSPTTSTASSAYLKTRNAGSKDYKAPLSSTIRTRDDQTLSNSILFN